MTSNKVQCAKCLRLFKSDQYFYQHFSYAKNAECYEEFRLRIEGKSPDKSPLRLSPTESSPYKTDEMAKGTPNSAKRSLHFAYDITHSPHQQQHDLVQQQEHVDAGIDENPAMLLPDDDDDIDEFVANIWPNPLQPQPVNAVNSPHPVNKHPDLEIFRSKS